MTMLRLHVPLSDARQWIQDGDLLLFRGRGAISAVGRGEHCHAALAGWWHDTLCCLEVRGGYGGRVVTLASQVRRYPGRIDVFQADPDHRWPEFDRRQTVQVMLQFAGERYGFRNLLRVAMFHLPLVRMLCRANTDDGRPPLSAPFCSQACVTATRLGGGVDPVPQLADEATEPADLARSPFYRYRVTLVPDEAPPSQKRETACGVFGRFAKHLLILGALLLGLGIVGQNHALSQTCPQGWCVPSNPPGLPTGSPAGVIPPGHNEGLAGPEGILAEQHLAQAVARIENRLPGGMAAYASGVLVAKDERCGRILTCDHLFREGIGRITVWLPAEAGFTAYEARLLARNSADDLALLTIAAPLNRPVGLADDPPRSGQQVIMAGYGPNGVYRAVRGQVLGYVQKAGSAGAETLQIRAAAREGDSGGPIVDTSGRVVAILWGTDGYRTVGTYCGRIRQFLANLLGGGDRLVGPPSPQPSPAPMPLPGEDLPSQPQVPQIPDDTGLPESAGLLARLQQRLEDLRSRFESAQTGQQSLSERLGRLEEGASLLGQLRERIERAEQVVGKDNIRAVIRQTAADLLAERGPHWLDAVLPAVLTALGWTGPPSLAVVLAARLAIRLVERRLRRSAKAAAAAGDQSRQSASLSEKAEA